MRSRWLILMLVLLLPMRLWAGQLMSTVHASAAPAQQVAADAAHGGCHGHAGAGHANADQADQPASVPDDAHHACEHCQLCHGGAMALGAMPADLPAPTLPHPAAADAPPASADLVLLLKPPMS